MGNKSCRNHSFRPYGIQAEDIRRIDGVGVDSAANPDAYLVRPFPVSQAPARQSPRPTHPMGLPQGQPYSVPQNSSYPGVPNAPIGAQPQQAAVIVENFDHVVAQYAQEYQQRPPQEGPTTLHHGMTKEALLLMQYRSRKSYMTWSNRRIYEDIIDRLEAGYLVLVETHREFLSFLHQQEEEQLQETGQTLGLAAQQKLISFDAMQANLKGIEAMIQQAHALRWESVNRQTAEMQAKFDAALRRGPADDGIIVATEHGTEILQSGDQQVILIGQRWAREKYKSALAELAVRDAQEYVQFWRNVREVRLEIPKDWSGRYDGEALPNGVITCNPYISRQRMIGNTVHGGAHLGDRQSKTVAESEVYAEQREKAMWQRMGRSNMEVFA